MANIFLIADTHFGHKGVCEFLNEDGSKLRPFENSDEMDEILVQNWNSVVKPSDKVYHLGDVVINRKALPTLKRLNGEKVLIKGNHDIFRIEEYLEYFKDVRGTHKLDSYILSHIPIHPHSIARWASGNIHGHLHSNVVEVAVGTEVLVGLGNQDIYAPDDRYICVSVEQINYTPISYEVLKKLHNKD